MTGEHPVDRIYAKHRVAAIAFYDRLGAGFSLDRAEQTILRARKALPLVIAILAYLARVDDFAE